MHVTITRKPNSNRYMVYNDEGYMFSLYGSEIRRFNIEDECDIDDDVIDIILHEIVYKRARERALFLLDRRMYSYNMLRNKLVLGGFPEIVVDSVMDFLDRYNYINDRDYIVSYVRNYSLKKSRKQLIYDLSQKGIDKQLIYDYFDNYDYSESDSFLLQFNKYILGKDINDPVVKQKIFRHFYSKGFAYSTIEQAFHQ